LTSKGHIPYNPFINKEFLPSKIKMKSKWADQQLLKRQAGERIT